MLWHIVRKDWKLLRHTILLVAFCNALVRILALAFGPFDDVRSRALATALSMIDPAAIIATAVLIVLIVQTDPIPDGSQDWLVRPIRRRDLLLAKAASVALFAQAPIFLFEAAECLANGFPLGASIAAPLGRSLYMFFALDLPVLALATLMHGLRRVIGAAFLCFLAYTIIWATIAQTDPLAIATRRLWLDTAAQLLWAAAAAAGILAFQYFRRRTTRARLAFAAGLLCWMALEFLPWRPLFAFEESLSRRPAAAESIHVAFDPSAGRLPHTGHGREAVHFNSGGAKNPGGAKRDIGIALPVRFPGLADTELLVPDHIAVRLTSPAGETVYDGVTTLGIQSADQRPYEFVWIPEPTYNRVKDQPLRLDLDYSLTLIQPDAEITLPVAAGDRWIPGFARCVTRFSAPDNYLDLACLAPGQLPPATLFLEKPDGRQISAHSEIERSNYAPFLARVSGDSITRMSANWGEAAAGDRIIIRPYTAAAHFTRYLTIPEIRLGEWRPQ